MKLKKLLTVVLFSICLMSFAQQKLPNLTLKDVDGKNVELAELSKGKTVVYSFWATWCVPCLNELDAIAEVYDDVKDKYNFELVAVATDDARTASRIKPLVNGKDWDYKVLVDSNQEFKRTMNISLIPHILVVKEGKVVYAHSGYTPGSESELFEFLEKL